MSLTGRMATSAGTLTLDGASDPCKLRSLTAVARVAQLVDLEPRHTVAEALAERCLMDDVPHRDGARRFAVAASLLELPVEPRGLIEELTGRDVTRLAVALACVRPSRLIVLDDLERDLDSAEQTALLLQLQELAAAQGPSIVVATVDRRAVDEAGVACTVLHHAEPILGEYPNLMDDALTDPDDEPAAEQHHHGRHEATETEQGDAR